MSSFKGDKVLKEHPTLSPLQASEEIMIYLSELFVLLERFETCFVRAVPDLLSPGRKHRPLQCFLENICFLYQIVFV